MTFQASLLYDFAGELSGELSVSAGDTITVTNPDVGQGWLFCIKDDGQEGFVPSHYVERVQDQGFSPSAPVMENNEDAENDINTEEETDVNKVNRLEAPEDKMKTPVDVIKKGHQSVSRDSKSPSSPDLRKRFSSIQKLITKTFGKEDEVCAYLMGITNTVETEQNQKKLIKEESEGNHQWVSEFEEFSCIVGCATRTSKFRGIKPFMFWTEYKFHRKSGFSPLQAL